MCIYIYTYTYIDGYIYIYIYIYKNRTAVDGPRDASPFAEQIWSWFWSPKSAVRMSAEFTSWCVFFPTGWLINGGV